MSDAPRVLVIDDDDAFRFAVRKALRRRGYEVSEAEGGTTALAGLRSAHAPDAAILDLRMRDMDGLEVLRARGAQCRTRIIVLTGHGTVQAAVEAMKLGAFSFLEKPVDAKVLGPILEQAVAEARGDDGRDDKSLPPLVGESRPMREVNAFVSRVGPTDETVMLFGETGTGKEVVARHLHAASARRDGPFVAMNAACVPRDLFESELFGHRRGAFTGATESRPGLFREAEGGTLFIDELGELPIDSQAKLLRALETRRIRPVGESGESQVDVRIVAATNRDLWAEVEAGRFREDLYFRLQVFPLVLPPLRDRADDLPLLAEHLLTRLGPNPPRLSAEAVDALSGYQWPGNVRELLNTLRRACLFAETDALDAALIRRMIAASVFGRAGVAAPAAPTASATKSEPPTRKSLAEVERAHIERVLADVDGNVTRAAAALGIDRRTLQRKMKAFEGA